MVFLLRIIVAEMLLVPSAMKLAAGHSPELLWSLGAYYLIAGVEMFVAAGVALVRRWTAFAWAAMLIGGVIVVLAFVDSSTKDCGCFGKTNVTPAFRAVYGACLGLLAALAVCLGNRASRAAACEPRSAVRSQ